MDLARKILFEMENSPNGFYEGDMFFEEYSSEQIGFHVHLLAEAGLIVGCDVTTMDSDSPIASPQSITWRGYEFLDACRDEERWINAKNIISKVKGASFDITMMILTELMKKQVLGA